MGLLTLPSDRTLLSHRPLSFLHPPILPIKSMCTMGGYRAAILLPLHYFPPPLPLLPGPGRLQRVHEAPPPPPPPPPPTSSSYIKVPVHNGRLQTVHVGPLPSPYLYVPVNNGRLHVAPLPSLPSSYIKVPVHNGRLQTVHVAPPPFPLPSLLPTLKSLCTMGGCRQCMWPPSLLPTFTSL